MSAPRRAATVLLLRAGQAGPGNSIEVLLVRRSQRAAFMADAYVFPGGRVDEVDRQAPCGYGYEAAARRAAARELMEEVGVRLPEEVVPRLPRFAHWITPSAEPRRFDTDFFLALLPAGQEPAVDGQEVVDLVWLTPAQALDRYAAGALKLPPPTHANLADLQREIGRHGTIEELLDACGRRRPVPVLPKLVPDPESGGIAVVLPWDPDFAALPGEGTPWAQPGPGEHPPPGPVRRYVLSPEGRWHMIS